MTITEFLMEKPLLYRLPTTYRQRERKRLDFTAVNSILHLVDIPAALSIFLYARELFPCTSPQLSSQQ